MPALSTLGYEGLEIPEFVGILKKAGIDILADIRAIPNSRKKGFSKKALAQEIARHGIDYIHLQELGSPKELRDKVRASGDYDAFFVAYNKYLDTLSEPLDKLLELVRTRRVCLLCFERDFNQCHRKAVAERLEKLSPKKIKAKHLG